ncbi:AbrB/MazE/SpoVT family DNA-binding domain-containing protein [Devosia oryziradicis]|uniref:AbrB/MazE/SpoVT family DNA-binding domain-containing protein n=1 Tax=Devosia oryziradicis TaxID=2801335 RepID=A0ABX7BYX9_9HYPH|nr:AbrB/MazE/SpoVT family DNA-binding domain-containing protein [Devosia oryziradicis]
MAEQRRPVELFRLLPSHLSNAEGALTITTLCVSTRGRITIPAAIRHELGLKGGDKLRYLAQDDGSYVVELVS